MFFDDVYQWFVSKVVLVTSSIIGSFDRAVVNDIGVDGPAKGIVWQARLLRHVQTGMLYNYALGMVVGALIAGLIWWMQ
jgi:NADH:ubiquinone oxidoreductase subunit 5 (subunit L)/multisubunit Na+/H+ antiporter MnhA subunit